MTSMMTKLAASAALATVLAGAAMAETTLIHAGHVLAEPGEGYLTRQTITVEDGKIVSVEAGYKRAPRGVEVIDLKDAYVLPGLIDSHVHITFESGPDERIKSFEDTDVDAAFDGAGFAYKTLMTGFTTVQDVGASNDAIFGLRDAIAKGNVPGPRIRAAGQAISVTGGHGDINGYSPDVMALFTGENICNGADDCRRAVRQQIKEGADLIKIAATGGVLSNTRAGLEQQFMDDELVAIVETAHSMGRKVTAHAHGKGGIVAALKAGIDSIEHGTYTDDETIALFKEHDAVLVPTVLAGATVTGWVNEPWLPAPSREKAAIAGPLMLDMLRRAHEGGVTVAFGTDTGVSKHGDNAGEFDLMVEAGFTPEEAIRAATVVASEHVEMADQIGTITSGKHADIIAVTGDPLKDISELRDVDFVMKGGTVYKRVE
ncbi:MAG: amidohydrolase family protein [Hyphomonas sp.]|nr:amidohydrolase family protein [Hyphomonas sp.]